MSEGQEPEWTTVYPKPEERGELIRLTEAAFRGPVAANMRRLVEKSAETGFPVHEQAGVFAADMAITAWRYLKACERGQV